MDSTNKNAQNGLIGEFCTLSAYMGVMLQYVGFQNVCVLQHLLVNALVIVNISKGSVWFSVPFAVLL